MRRLKRQEKDVCAVADRVFLSSCWPAKRNEVLANFGITHIINAAAWEEPCAFRDQLAYHDIYINDGVREKLLPVLPEALMFIRRALESNESNKVLIHCVAGISRSASVAVAYVMWAQAQSFEQALAQVQAARSVAQPNTGFVAQLQEFGRILVDSGSQWVENEDKKRTEADSLARQK